MTVDTYSTLKVADGEARRWSRKVPDVAPWFPIGVRVNRALINAGGYWADLGRAIEPGDIGKIGYIHGHRSYGPSDAIKDGFDVVVVETSGKRAISKLVHEKLRYGEAWGWRERALEHLEDAVQVLGKQSEKTRSPSAHHAMLDSIERIDELGNEIKLIDEKLP